MHMSPDSGIPLQKSEFDELILRGSQELAPQDEVKQQLTSP
jgi:hypothetical protein